MKKTTFQNIELLVTIAYDQTFTDHLEADDITYTTRTLPIFQTLLPVDTLSYGGYEISYKEANGNQKYVYSFITKKTDFTKCVTFFPEEKLDNLYVLDLESALRTGALILEEDDDESNIFKGFDFSKEIKIEQLLDKNVTLTNGCSYIFTSISEFPEGIIGKKILKNGDAIKVFLAKTGDQEPCFTINEAGLGWQILNKEKITSVFGMK